MVDACKPFSIFAKIVIVLVSLFVTPVIINRLIFYFCSREASCAFIHDRTLRVPDVATTGSSMTSPVRLSPSKIIKNSSPSRTHLYNEFSSTEQAPLAHPPCYINFISGRETIAEFSAGAACKNWALPPFFADELEQGQQQQQQLQDASMMQMFSSIIRSCNGTISVMLGMNPAEPINGVVLKAAAVDLPRLKAM